MQLVRAAYLGMEVVATSVIVPLAFAAFVTGIVQAFSTKWGLFRHFWVLAKLGLTVAASVVLVMQLKHIRAIADAAQARPLSLAIYRGLERTSCFTQPAVWRSCL